MLFSSLSKEVVSTLQLNREYPQLSLRAETLLALCNQTEMPFSSLSRDTVRALQMNSNARPVIRLTLCTFLEMRFSSLSRDAVSALLMDRDALQLSEQKRGHRSARE